jgi:Glycosyl hydrolases family 2, TIM barrel domain/Glycosyl hydrolases family 2, sugar binding domain/Glycosyl hydrolases family 2
MTFPRFLVATSLAFAALSQQPTPAADWAPAQGPLMTRWARDVRPDHALPEYPRPQMVRKDWANLNGLWHYAVRPKTEARPDQWDGQILVPFPIESALSGVMMRVSPDDRVWYRRSFTRPAAHPSGRLLLHLGAVDWETTVWVNGKEVGTHRGGYDPFSFDITAALKPGGEQELVVAVWDPADAGTQPRGKQVRQPRGIWYTPTTGIWQTVWLEPVPQTYITSLTIVPDVSQGRVTVTAPVAAPAAGDEVELEVPGVASPGFILVPPGRPIVRPIPNPTLWTPDAPHLYDLRVRVMRGGRVIDEVSSYFGMRSIALAKDASGVTRAMLNGKPLFQYGLLDQGFWPDGLYTAPTDDALKSDIEATKRLGFNLARKHVKVEPDRWYYWCDKLGLLVWQDMPSGDKYIRAQDPDITRTPESAKQFDAELKAMIDALRNHPSIVMWVPFNEGWGQFDTARVAAWVKQHDPTRLVNSASGWTDRGVGDVHDIHAYPGPGMPRPEEKRAAVLGEFGGLGLPVKGHTWQAERNWGYRSFQTPEELTAAYERLIVRMRPLIGRGLSAAIYTQTTDVEIEVNGMLTYDRALVKMDAAKVAAANRYLHLPPPTIVDVVPTSQAAGHRWRYTTTKPAAGWEQTDFNDGAWQEGPGGFGTAGTPGAVVRTTWNTADIWLRRTADLNDVPADLHLLVHHDEDAEIYINGVLAAKVGGFVTDYGIEPISAAALKALRPGTNHIAVHCHQTGGGQYIDVGLVRVQESVTSK